MQFLMGFPEILSRNRTCYHSLSVSGNSKILHCGILINMPCCMSLLIYKPHPYCSLLTVTGASHVTTSNSFCGSRAWSEPCVNNMRGALESLKSRLKVYMTLHSYGQMWFVPYAWSRVAFPQDYQNLVSVEFSSLGYQFNVRYPPASAPDHESALIVYLPK